MNSNGHPKKMSDYNLNSDHSQKAWGDFVPDLTKARVTEKPRTKGLTMVLDRCQGLHATEDLLAMTGDYIDHIKLSFGTSALLSEAFLRRKIEMVRQYGIEIYPGGTMMELALVQGCFPKCSKRAKELGFTALEISDGTINVPRHIRDDLIKRALDTGFKVITEVGKKDPTVEIPLSEMCDLIESDLALGASHVIIEARESGMGIGIFDANGRVLEDKAAEIFNCFSPETQDSLIWEAPRSKQQATLILQYGPNVSFGNVKPRDVLSLESLRRGLRYETFRQFAPRLEPLKSTTDE